MRKVLLGIAAAAAALIAVPAGATTAQAPVNVMLLHGIPGATVDVAVDGAVVVPGFKPGDMQDLSSFAGQTLKNVEVRAAGTTDVVIGPIPELAVPASGNWTVVAHLDAAGKPTLTPFQNDTSAVAAGSGRLTVVHAAAAPAVDIVLGDARPVKNLVNGKVQSLTLPAGPIAGAQIAPTGGAPIAPVPTVEVKAGQNLTVYAVGSLEAGSLTFYTQTIPLAGSTTAPTAVNTGGAVDASSNTLPLFAAAAGLFALAGGAIVLRRRTVEA